MADALHGPRPFSMFDRTDPTSNSPDLSGGSYWFGVASAAKESAKHFLLPASGGGQRPMTILPVRQINSVYLLLGKNNVGYSIS